MPALALERCEVLFSPNHLTLKISDSDWERWVSQNRHRKPEIAYADNQSLALNTIFIPWVLGQSRLGFVEMQRQMHKVSAIGDGDQGGIYGTPKYLSSQALPGKTRFDVFEYFNKIQDPAKKAALLERSPFVNLIMNSLSGFDVPLQGVIESFVPFSAGLTKHLREQAALPLNSPPPAELILEFPNGFRIYRVRAKTEFDEKNPANYTIAWNHEFPGVDSTRSGGFEVEFNVFHSVAEPAMHRAPNPADLSKYFKLAEKLMGVLRENFMKPVQRQSRGNITPEQTAFLNLLADYYQVLICAHPFVRINQSLFMNQVNFFLNLNGWTPLYHGRLDFWAMTLQRDEFQRFFTDEVLQQHIQP